MSTDILIPMADHIALAAARAKEGRALPNPFNQDIKALFDREYQAALKGREIIYQMTGVYMPEDEVGYIAIHIHAGLSEENVAQAMDMARLVQDSVALIERDMKVGLKADSLGHNRLVSHLRYMIARSRKGEKLNLDMEAYAREQFPGPYATALSVCRYMEQQMGTKVAPQEAGFLAIHIQRVIQGE